MIFKNDLNTVFVSEHNRRAPTLHSRGLLKLSQVILKPQNVSENKHPVHGEDTWASQVAPWEPASFARLLRPRSRVPGKPILSGESLENWLRLEAGSFREWVKLLAAFKDPRVTYTIPAAPLTRVGTTS